jgi:DNA-binding NarL/FixJ family response regulator
MSEPNEDQPRLLVVEDEWLVARSLQSLVQSMRVPLQFEVAHNVAEAWKTLASGDAWAGWIIDVRLPDGNGVDDVLVWARSQRPAVPALLVTGAMSPEVANQGFDLGADTIYKPIKPERIRKFVLDAYQHFVTGALRSSSFPAPPVPRMDAQVQLPERVLRAVHRLRAFYGLTAAEERSIVMRAAGWSLEDIVDQLGLSRKTMYNQVSNIRSKCGGADLHDLALRAWRDAHLGESS